MSKSLKRVKAALETAGLEIEIIETENARTAQDAADAVGCEIDQIAKSILFEGADTGEILLFLTAGGHRVDQQRAAGLAGQPLTRADASKVREVTGFAIGGVSPVGHLTPVQAFLDPRLTTFDTVWAAAGTPRHLFRITPAQLAHATRARTGSFTE
ncbi:YbaK/EbsC family protein [Thioclava sp. GXIMD4215]|uniref:YbaK/EbsC family protein n=1 Tax=Thioclava sp. GXIMD4215 TaxID=3131928 RepID=UPI0032542315